MKKIKIAFLSLLATCTIASCDFLEKEPYKMQAVTTWSFMEGLPDVFPIQD